jgi:hypothetical protein
MTKEISSKPKITAEDNSWYLLATLYGDPTSDDCELQVRNRRAWNRYMSRALDQRDRDRIPRHLVDEMVPFSPEELADFGKAFAQRHQEAGSAASPIPPELKPEDQIDFSDIHFNCPLLFDGFVFPVVSRFTRATFSQPIAFNAIFLIQVYFEDATFSERAVFEGATLSRGAYFGRDLFRNGFLHGSDLFRRSLFRERDLLLRRLRGNDLRRSCRLRRRDVL